MENLKVLLCCGNGLSSGFLAQQGRKAAKKKGVDIKIEAKSEAEAVAHMPKIHVLLLAPHYETFKEKFAELAKPYHVAVGVIPQKVYGALDGEKLVEYAIELHQSNKL
ncbi:PTS sugar transporter subunit IIB [Lacrimispora sp.]|uniref:PTS sugar transporter subunit IIB n=1 Tax=Lacrimispora sp. TaxID=2719234 RepID=UPI00345FC72B